MENEPYQLGVNEFKREVLKHVAKLIDNHFDEIKEAVDESETQKIKIGFGTLIDQSKPYIKLNTKMRFSVVVSDEASSELDSLADEPTFNFAPVKEKQEFGEPDDTCYVCLGKKVVNKTNSGGVVIGTAPCNACDGTGINPVEEDPKQGEEGED